MLSLFPLTEERNVDLPEMSTSVTLTSAQSTVYYLIGLNGANATRLVVVENPNELVKLQPSPNLEANLVAY